MGESKLKNKILFDKQYMTESLTNVVEAFPITSLILYSEKSILILGDEFGNIACWNLDNIFELLSKTKV